MSGYPRSRDVAGALAHKSSWLLDNWSHCTLGCLGLLWRISLALLPPPSRLLPRGPVSLPVPASPCCTVSANHLATVKTLCTAAAAACIRYLTTTAVAIVFPRGDGSRCRQRPPSSRDGGRRRRHLETAPRPLREPRRHTAVIDTHLRQPNPRWQGAGTSLVQLFLSSDSSFPSPLCSFSYLPFSPLVGTLSFLSIKTLINYLRYSITAFACYFRLRN